MRAIATIFVLGVVGCGGDAADVGWTLRFAEPGVERSGTRFDVLVRSSCDDATALSQFGVGRMEGARIVEVDRDAFAIDVTAVDGDCVAYAGGCAEVSAGDEAVEVVLEAMDEESCGAGACVEGRCVDDPSDASMPDAAVGDGGPLDAGRLDAGVADAGRADAGTTDGGGCDPLSCPGRRCEAGACAHFTTCDALAAADTSAPSGVYAIAPAGEEPFNAYCEMDEGAGWTLLLKVDGTRSTFEYEAGIWEDETLLNETSLDLSETEAKLEGYSSIAFTQLRVGLRVGETTRWLDLTVSGDSLLSAMGGERASTDAGRDAWLSLHPDAVVQTDCNSEGLNVGPELSTNHSWVRIGLLGNNEGDCGSPDSAIGIGIRSHHQDPCGDPFSTSAGSVSACYSTARTEVPAFGYVLVR